MLEIAETTQKHQNTFLHLGENSFFFFVHLGGYFLRGSASAMPWGVLDLVYSMTLRKMQKGQVVVKEGDAGEEFFIIHEGEWPHCGSMEP